MVASNLRRRFMSQHGMNVTTSTSSIATDTDQKSSETSSYDEEVREIFNQILTVKTLSACNSSELEILQEEARRLTESIAAATERDNENRAHNRKAQFRERVGLLLGIVCLCCPVLIIFDMILSYIPMVDIRSLEFASQQRDRLGQVSRLCLVVIRLANGVRVANRIHGGIYIAGCIGGLFLILMFLQRTSGRRVTLTPHQRRKLMRLQAVTVEELEKRKLSRDRSASKLF